MRARLAIGVRAASRSSSCATPAQAAEQRAYAAGMNYATPAVTVGQGDTLIFSNLDTLAQHDLVGHGGEFQTPLIGAGEEAKVEGVEKLQPGTYQFHCTLHSWMQGALTVSARPAARPCPRPARAPAAAPGAAATRTRPTSTARPPRASTAGSWPFYGRDLRNTPQRRRRRARPPDQVDDLGIAWSYFSGEGDFTGTPVVARGLVVAGTNKGKVVALDAKTGKQKWAHKIGKTINGTVAVSGYRVFVPVSHTHTPRIVALDLRTGRAAVGHGHRQPEERRRLRLADGLERHGLHGHLVVLRDAERPRGQHARQRRRAQRQDRQAASGRRSRCPRA